MCMFDHSTSELFSRQLLYIQYMYILVIISSTSRHFYVQNSIFNLEKFPESIWCTGSLVRAVSFQSFFLYCVCECCKHATPWDSKSIFAKQTWWYNFTRERLDAPTTLIYIGLARRHKWLFMKMTSLHHPGATWCRRIVPLQVLTTPIVLIPLIHATTSCKHALAGHISRYTCRNRRRVIQRAVLSILPLQRYSHILYFNCSAVMLCSILIDWTFAAYVEFEFIMNGPILYAEGHVCECVKGEK